jgi:AAA15 family ATPase/GTPase
MIDKLRLRNFTVFDDIEIDFSPGINIIIGENGTGKTHLMKAAYVLAGATRDDRFYRHKISIMDTLTKRMIGVFDPLDSKLGNIAKNESSEKASLDMLFDASQRIRISFNKEAESIVIETNQSYEQYSREPVFIPTKEILSLIKHSDSKESLEEAFKSLFDETYTDLFDSLMVQHQSDHMDWIDLDPRLGDVYPKLINIIGGVFHLSETTNYFQPGRYIERMLPGQNALGDTIVTVFQPEDDTKISNNMTAEGLRKLGILQHLILNREIEPGERGTLFWDEPEANINPKLVKNVVEILISLARNGQQIVLATHHYVLLKWFDLMMNNQSNDNLRFHVLSRDPSSKSIFVESADCYRDISRNAIADSYNALTKEQVRLRMGALGK